VPGQQQVAAAPASTEPPAAGGGGFVVQLTAEGSEAAARSEFTRLRGRHSEVLGGLSPNIRRAEVNGNTVYRVRVGAFSRAEAVSLCERLKSSGGNCFVARN
jgi:cell division septation protein DedD